MSGVSELREVSLASALSQKIGLSQITEGGSIIPQEDPRYAAGSHSNAEVPTGMGTWVRDVG